MYMTVHGHTRQARFSSQQEIFSGSWSLLSLLNCRASTSMPVMYYTCSREKDNKHAHELMIIYQPHSWTVV